MWDVVWITVGLVRGELRHTLLNEGIKLGPQNLEDCMDSKYNEEQPESTPSYGSDDQESGMELLSHPRCLSAIPGEVQEMMDEDSESESE